MASWQAPLLTSGLCHPPPAPQADMCTKFKVSGYPAMRLGTAGELAALAVDKLVDVRPASRHADSVVAFLAKQLDV